MCGILFYKGLNPSFTVEEFESALSLLSSRGPDARNLIVHKDYIMGHTLLRVDSYNVNSTIQPYTTDENNFLLFNGEIFNKNELVHSTNSQIDTEILYEYLRDRKSDKDINNLNGMWAFIFISGDKVLISRDRFGEKPLYYLYTNDGGIIISSEPKCILQLYPQERIINDSAVVNFLFNNSLHNNEETFYKNIKHFRPANSAVLINNKLSYQPYWVYPSISHSSISNDLVEKLFSNLFEDAVKIRSACKCKYATAISGGIDSTAIAATLSKINVASEQYFVTSKYQTDGIDEVLWAKSVSNEIKSEFFEVLTTDDGWIKKLKAVIYKLDSPSYSPAIIPHTEIMHKLRESNFRVILEGQGADELFGGYPEYCALDIIKSIIFDKNILKAINKYYEYSKFFDAKIILLWCLRLLLPKLYFFYKKRKSLLKEEISKHIKYNDEKINNNSILLRLKEDHSKNILPGLLNYGDIVGMSNGIEVRNPFVDHRIVELIFSLNEDDLINSKKGPKWILKEYLRMNGFGFIADRTKKQGYPTPILEWIIKDKKVIYDYLITNNNEIFKWIDKKKLEKVFKIISNNSYNASFHIFKILTLDLWIRSCIKNE